MTDTTAAPDEGDWVRRARAGDVAAFAALYRTHVGVVTRVVRGGISNPEAVADIVQDVFLKALERLGALREPHLFRPWLLSIARHAVVDSHRAAGRARVISLDLELAPEPVAAGPSAEELAELAELAGLVAGCVAGLSPRDAIAVSMVTHLGLGPAEVAIALGVSRETAKVVVHRARQRLRDGLALELMVRRQGPRCLDLDAIDDHNLLAAARHLRSCPVCAALVEAEVHLYGLQAETLHPHAGIA